MDWKSEYSIGIPEIDEQHKQLFDCIDRLEAAGDDRQRELAVYYVMRMAGQPHSGQRPALRRLPAGYRRGYFSRPCSLKNTSRLSRSRATALL